MQLHGFFFTTHTIQGLARTNTDSKAHEAQVTVIHIHQCPCELHAAAAGRRLGHALQLQTYGGVGLGPSADLPVSCTKWRAASVYTPWTMFITHTKPMT